MMVHPTGGHPDEKAWRSMYQAVTTRRRVLSNSFKRFSRCNDEWGGHILFLHRQLRTAKAFRASGFLRHHLGKSHTDHVLENQRAMLGDVPLASESNILNGVEKPNLWTVFLHCWFNVCLVNVCISLNVGESINTESMLRVKRVSVHCIGRKGSRVWVAKVNKDEATIL
jgi:hypothetical protein